MCGIAGYERARDDGERAAGCLLDEMRSRGPDGGWSKAVGGWTICQTRLAVIDLSPEVRYPMPNEAENLWLLFNGEIYNHDELRDALRARGHEFQTRCDGEVVVHGYEEWGDDVFRRLNGMWALAILDQRTGELVLARDPRGIKPLVFTTSGRFAFGSDAMALVAAGLVPAVPDVDAIAEFALFQYVPPPATGIANVAQLPPGSVLRRRAEGSTRLTNWARPVFSEASPDRAVSLADADHVLREAVRRQLKADVEVGVFLSGGVDSALVLDYAVETGARPTAFTIAFEGFGDYDESTAARDTARRLGVPHELETVRSSFTEALARVTASYDMPFADASAIATLPLAELASRKVKVALSGTGGDDLFAGYYRHRAPRLAQVLRRVPSSVRDQATRLDPGRGNERASVVTLARAYTARLARAAASSDRSLYLELVAPSPGIADRLLAAIDVQGARERVAARHSLPEGVLSLEAIQNFELATYLPGDLLVKEDRATMAYSVEGRVPLLDDEMTALAACTPAWQRAGWTSGKRLLRELARCRLPGRRPGRKRGFAVPLGALMAGPWRRELDEWLRDGASDLVDSRSVSEEFARGDVEPQDVWALCVLMGWEQRLARAGARGRTASPV